MTNQELKQLAALLSKLKEEKPELTVLVTDADYDALYELQHGDKQTDFYSALDVVIDLQLEGWENALFS